MNPRPRILTIAALLVASLLLFRGAHAAGSDADLAVFKPGDPATAKLRTVDALERRILELLATRDPGAILKGLRLGPDSSLADGLKWLAVNQEFANIATWEVCFDACVREGKLDFSVGLTGRYLNGMAFRNGYLLHAADPRQGAGLVASAKARYLDVLRRAADRAIAPAEQARDLADLVATLEATHPNLHAVIGEAAFRSAEAVVAGRCTRARSMKAFHADLSAFVASLKDGHTDIGGFPEFSRFALFGGCFPVTLRIDVDAIFVARCSPGMPLEPGSRLLDVNGVPAPKLIAALARFDNFERPEMFRALVERNFEYYAWLAADILAPFDVGYRSPGGKTGRLRLAGADGAGKRALGVGSAGSPYDYRFDARRGAGVLTFNAFADLDAFRALTARMRADLAARAAKHLVIDLRRNGGGDSTLGDHLYACLSDRPYFMYSRVDVKISELAKAAHPESYANDPIGTVKSFASRESAPEELADRFAGRVWLLVGPGTFSSAADFAALMKDYGRATLVGEETGGLATSYGDTLRFRLPESRFPVGVSYKRFVRPSGADDGRGVLPDVTVSPSDATPGNDPALERVFRLIEGSEGR